jgi:hypothetical protein
MFPGYELEVAPFQLTVKCLIDPASFSFTHPVPNNCDNERAIQISYEPIFGVDYSFLFTTNSSNVAVYSENSLVTHLEEGIYAVKIVDQVNCEVLIPDAFEIVYSQECVAVPDTCDLVINEIVAEETNPTCQSKGKIEIQINGDSVFADKELTLTHVGSKSSITSRMGLFTEAKSGFYDLTVSSMQHDCSQTFENIAYIEKEPLCESKYITPNGDGRNDELYIDQQGVAKVYDKTGYKVNEFPVPHYFDGTDMSGSPLPMGHYLIIINNETQMELSVLK